MKRELRNQSEKGYPGLLISIEGTDGAGRTTQIERLRSWLAIEGYGVVISEWKTSSLIANAIDLAKERNLLHAYTFSLLYASDFADRLEHVILPALKAGLIVLTDRYTYTAYARDVVRGVSPEWIRRLYDFAPEPDLVFYLNMPVEILLKRIIASSGLDYYESGRDIGLSTDFYESFKIYQRKIISEYSKMEKEYNFETIDGTLSIEAVQTKMRKAIKEFMDSGVIR
ncbi:MAG: dTMP kinase [Candidatus Melainabacteria bacterium GWF2_37_15]|nr:MAG: dTMP kinase [Candidatus Melainabacteria bacterium GWF2_37_15]